MKKPYLKKIREINGLHVWYADGMYVRKNLNEEFTNYGDNYIFNFIPKNEVWIDKEFGKKEYNYYIKFSIVRNKLIKSGKTKEKALKQGELIEQKERNKSKLVQKLKKIKNKKQIIKKIHKKLLRKYSNNKIKVWIVNGFLVRSLFFLDFTEGGHDKVYKFVPKNEVWIDDALNPKELKYVLIHELHERALMKKAWSYNKAHKDSSKIELFCRKHPREVKRILKKEIEKINKN